MKRYQFRKSKKCYANSPQESTPGAAAIHVHAIEGAHMLPATHQTPRRVEPISSHPAAAIHAWENPG